MNGESSTGKFQKNQSNNDKETPVKIVKRDVRGLLSLQQESPGHSDVVWNCLDSPLKTNRTVGGKSKSLRSSNQLTPRHPNTRKKFYSSPILVARIPEECSKDEIRGNSMKDVENNRILEEFQRQFNDNYVPRNLLDNLCDTLDDSIVAPDAEINQKNSKSQELKLSDHEYEFTDQEDLDVLAEIEEEARRQLDEKASSNNVKDQKSVPTLDLGKMPTLKTIKPEPSTSKSIVSTKKSEYFDSDDDDIILSIPFEKIAGEILAPSTALNSKNQPNSKNNISSNKNNSHNKIGKNNHTSVIPAKREYTNVKPNINRIENQSIQKPIAQSNNEIDNMMLQEPIAKRKCTSEEIAEKRRQAMQRREAYLRNLRSQKVSNK